ncbi:MAG: hypothetical protein JNM10_05525 [Planctomycetia bacterium]|nr:hypothetical protein [Planctomycetia bacterium]
MSGTRASDVVRAAMLATLWTVVGALKLADPTGLAEYTASTLGVRPTVSHAIAILVASVEVAVGLTLFATIRRPRRPIVAVALGAALAATVAALFSGGAACGCFGAAARATQGRRLVLGGVLLYLGLDLWASTAPGLATRPRQFVASRSEEST